jgi:hypothetical protein
MAADVAEVQSALTQALDPTTLSDTAATYGSGSANTSAMRVALWTRLETFMESLLKIAIRIRHLERVLAKKKDPTTQVRFLDDVLPPKEGKTSLVVEFWARLAETMAKSLGKLNKSAPFIHQAFVGEYPRLLKLCKDMCARIPQQSRLENLGTGATEQVETDMLAQAMSAFENGYVQPNFGIARGCPFCPTPAGMY